MASTDDKQQLIGWWINYLIDKVNTKGAGLSKRELKKQGDIGRNDPDVLGQFRIQITDENADEVCNAVFSPQANQ